MLEELLQKLQAITADAKTALSAASTPADVEAVVLSALSHRFPAPTPQAAPPPKTGSSSPPTNWTRRNSSPSIRKYPAFRHLTNRRHVT